ncbi:MAG: UDP-N-acetylglucosamine 1-carboxyvinyltransferase [Candidatus Schekmanbacteria bacterium]|nr:UDP-N-acetylglucosamine 1-carboxyvinyltransferase [Candidatus Schekmanbacteria bacterium]
MELDDLTVAEADSPTYRLSGSDAPAGVYFVQGSKNTALPAIAAALLPEKGATILRNVPPLNDVVLALRIARVLGARVDYYPAEQIAVIDAANLHSAPVPAALTSRLRASVLFLAPLLARLGEAHIDTIGGCSLGDRGVDFHYRGFVRMGAVQEPDLALKLTERRLRGATTYLDVPSHTGTENLMMAAAVAEGTTIIENAGCDPEIADFAEMLRRMGAHIHGTGSRTVRVEGVTALRPTEYTIPPDRLDAGFAAALATIRPDAEIAIIGFELDRLRLVAEKLSQMGAHFHVNGQITMVSRRGKLRPINIVTHPYPGFATDLQPAVMALACIAEGTSYIREEVFSDRFSHSEELGKMGAEISIEQGNRLAVVHGVARLVGAHVTAHNIRAGIATLLAATAAEGETVIDNAYQIERGHVDLPRRLAGLGVNLRRELPNVQSEPHV